MHKQNRQQIRDQIKQQRRALSKEIQHQHSQQAAGHIINTPIFKNAEHIAFYLASGGELDPLAIMQTAWALGKKVYLPIMHPTRKHHLLFSPYFKGDTLVHNHYGILEPPLDIDKIILPWNLDLVFTPLVAFDKSGNRIGQGAGCYDRCFEFLHTTNLTQPKLVGVGHQLQQLEKIQAESWDIPLTGLLTEKYFLEI